MIASSTRSVMLANAFSRSSSFRTSFSLISSLRRPSSRFSTETKNAETKPAAGPTVIPNPEAYNKLKMDDIVSLCKRRGIIFPSSEIYNGFAGFYDYGPLGAELKKNVKDAWWRNFVTRREDIVGLDSSIIHNPTTWKSSGACLLLLVFVGSLMVSF